MSVNCTSSLALLRNQGGGGFGGLATWTLPAHPVGIAAAELTGDGDVDLVVALAETGSAAILHNINAATGVGPGEGATPPAFALYGTRENPFRRGETVIGYSLDRDRAVTLVLYDVTGRAVRVLADGVRAAGYHDVRWDGRDVRGGTSAPGIYFLRLTA